MAEVNRCPKCNAELRADSPGGLCPKCLLQAGYESQAGPSSADRPTASSPPAAGFVPPMIEELARHFPQLEVLELLGKGGMGAVYKARQPGLDRLVAIKILPPEVGRDPAFAERFTREARALARLGHPNIVSVYDFGQRDGLFYIVMEYVDGVNLRQAILAGGMSPEQALAIVPQICDALQFAHDEGIVHRDIKPENILLDKRGRVKIADFGLAKLFGTAADQTLTGEHQVMGTLRYMAPEQLEGTHAVDHRADIYSLGVVFYELLTGELPIGRFAPPSKKVQIDVRLDEVVLRALEKEPEHRYQHASQVKSEVEAIRSVAGAAGGSAHPAMGQQWPIGTVLVALLAFAASFMPWGSVRIGDGNLNLLVRGELVLITGWNSNLTVGDVAIPNWTLAIVALVVAALALLQAATAYDTRHFISILAAYGIVQAGLMCWSLAINGRTGIGAPATLAAFGAIVVAPIFTKSRAANHRLARFVAALAFTGNFSVAMLGYFASARLFPLGLQPIWRTAVVGLLVSLLIASVFYAAILLSKRMQLWVTPVVHRCCRRVRRCELRSEARSASR
jgi:tRNA A-37 threonylcarbamoyl transferase component Bud32